MSRPFWQWALPLLGVEGTPPVEESLSHAPAPPPDRLHAELGRRGALSGVRVIDLSGEFATYGTRLLADLGAEVLRIEPPEGAAIRRAPPLHQEQSFTQLYLDAGKRSVVLDLDEPAGRRKMAQLLATADLLYEDGPPGALAARGFGWDRLCELNRS